MILFKSSYRMPTLKWNTTSTISSKNSTSATSPPSNSYSENAKCNSKNVWFVSISFKSKMYKNNLHNKPIMMSICCPALISITLYVSNILLEKNIGLNALFVRPSLDKWLEINHRARLQLMLIKIWLAQAIPKEQL